MLLPGFVAQAGSRDKILHTFSGGPQGGLPTAALTSDGHGGFFGTTGSFQDFDGAVFELSPPAGSAHHWALNVLHVFRGPEDGLGGDGTLVADAGGNLFGVTQGGGASRIGSVFELSPPAQGGTRWTRRIIFSFTNARRDGTHPAGGIIFDAAGALYGVTVNGGDGPCFTGCGTVFKLTPPTQRNAGGGAWTETVLHAFANGHDGANPMAALIMDAAGDIFGTTVDGGVFDQCSNGCGTIFRLTPENGGAHWRFSVIKELTRDLGVSPHGSLLADEEGNLFGTAFAGGRRGHGTAFELSPPLSGESAWHASVLHSFTGGNDGYFPQSALIAGAGGILYGTTELGGADSQGVVFALHPPATLGAHWTEEIVHAFRYHHDGHSPVSPVIFGLDGLLYGTTYQGGKYNLGAFYQVPP